MTDEQQVPFFRAGQVCEKLGVNYKVLEYLRKTGKIEGTRFGNYWVYTQEQVDNARLERDKPGPKAGSKRGKRQPNDSKEVSNSSDTVAPEWRISGRAYKTGPEAQLVGV